MTAVPWGRLDAGTLVPQQQGEGLELRAHGRRHAAAQGSRLDLTGSSGEHRDDVALVAGASLLRRGGTASALLALAWSSQKLLLWNAGHGGHGIVPLSPADGTRNVPGSGPLASDAEPGLRISEDQRSGHGRRLRTRNRQRVAGDHDAGESRLGTTGSVLGASMMITPAGPGNSRPT